MMEKYGPDKLQDHFMVMDTICDATQVSWCSYRSACVARRV